MSSAVPVMGFERLRIETYTEVAATALLIYDYFITFDREVTMIWPTHLSFVKVLFLLVRYMPFADVTVVLYYQLKVDIIAETCTRLYVTAGWLIVSGIVIAEIILLLRTWAIWGRGRRLGIFIAASYTAVVVAVIIIESMFLKSVRFAPHPGRATPGCLLSSGSAIIAINFILVIVVETFVLSLTLVKGLHHYRLMGPRGLFAVLYRDVIVFYTYLLSISVINLIIIIAAPRDLADILALLQRVLHSCLGARVLINLREAQNREYDANSTTNPTSLRVLTRPGNQGVSAITYTSEDVILLRPMNTFARGETSFGDSGNVRDVS